LIEAADTLVSGRREDSAGHAGRLYDALSQRFGDDHVFMDVDAIDARTSRTSSSRKSDRPMSGSRGPGGVGSADRR
jgi:hypothetical protein